MAAAARSTVGRASKLKSCRSSTLSAQVRPV